MTEIIDFDNLNDIIDIGLDTMSDKVSFNTFQIYPICMIYSILKMFIEDINAKSRYVHEYPRNTNDSVPFCYARLTFSGNFLNNL